MRKLMKLMEAAGQVGWDEDSTPELAELSEELFVIFDQLVARIGMDNSETAQAVIDAMDPVWHLVDQAKNSEPVEEDMWPHDKPYPKTPPVSADLANADVENHIERAAMALAKDAIVQAAGVYDEEGPGKGKFATGAQSQDEYVRIAAVRFLDKDYKKAILVNFQQQFEEYVDYWLNET